MESELKDNQMQRGINQSLYKYLPLSWVDFFKKNDRSFYTAFVEYWNSDILEGINTRRLLSQVHRKVSEYHERGQIKDFVLPVNQEQYDVRTPSPGLNADIMTKISPLTFYCESCSKVHHYRSSSEFLERNARRKCIAPHCKGTIKQMSFVYSCSCGFAAPLEPIGCQKHGTSNLYFKYGEYHYFCKHEQKKIEMMIRCHNCKKWLKPKNAQDLANHIPMSFTMIDLLDVKMDQYVLENNDGAKMIIARWLDQLSREDLQDIIANSHNSLSEVDKQRKLEETITEFMHQVPGLDPVVARQLATASQEVQSGQSVSNKAKDFLAVHLGSSILHSNELQQDLSLQLLEYDMVLEPSRHEGGIVSTLANATEVARKLNTLAEPERFFDIANNMGFRHVQASGNISFVLCSYGFTRRETEPGKATLVGFPAEKKTKKNIYASKLKTEGILFELDRRRIIEWLLKNNYIERQIDGVPDNLEDEVAVKNWFLNKVNGQAIHTFSPVDKDGDKITYYVYNLVHALSHALLRQAANLCGLDKNSLSEYIFPNVPAFFIYCQNSQGLTIGALFNLFEAYFDKWLTSAKEAISQCIFDPVCIDRDHACAGCLYLNEVSCVHFNKDLDRRLLNGWYDRYTDTRMYGFWEGI